MRRALTIALVLAAAAPARADEVIEPGAPTDHDRVVEGAITLAMGTGYLVAEFGFNHQLSPDECQWCNPPGFDRSMRDVLKWRDTARANTLSNTTGYLLAPLSATGLTILAGSDGGWRRHYDDVTPVIQAAIATSLVQHATKLLVARQRPYAHFAPPGSLVASDEDNVSFFSGHTSLTFSLAVAAGTVANMRGYSLAPAIWTIGLALAATTGYLRIAADRHYTTDVLTGAAVGSLIGYAWPKLLHPRLGRHTDVVPTSTGLAVIGSF
jgi:membrane-associated phospholipid phosphatase